MNKIYKDGSDELCSLVTVSESRGRWIANSDSPACENTKCASSFFPSPLRRQGSRRKA